MGILSSFNNAATTALNVVAVSGNAAAQLINSIGQGSAVAESTAIAWRIEQEAILVARLATIKKQMDSIDPEDLKVSTELLAKYRI